MHSQIVSSLSQIPAHAWDALAGDANPFIRYAFLSALEQHRCLHDYGWYPQHILIYDQQQLIGAMPLYLKDNSYGELVFDWSWAQAYQRSGLHYYPKLVCAIPYTPHSGPRLLTLDTADRTAVATEMVNAAMTHAQQIGASGVHWLFTDADDTTFLKSQNLPLRMDCQFHWQNHHYQSFDDFLATLSADKRKKIKRERRRVMESNIRLEFRHGEQMTEADWVTFHRFYRDTFARKSGIPTLSLEFFQSLGETMGTQVVVVFAHHGESTVACAFNLRGSDTLYGRHWGCSADYHSLHFEACYYQGIDYCIAQRLQRFEPGAQGEHKLSRGFLPAATWSAHWLAAPEFQTIIQRFCSHEQQVIGDYIQELAAHSPYRNV